MSTEKPREFRAWTWELYLKRLEDRTLSGDTVACYVCDNPGDAVRRVPIRITIEDPSDPKPDWPVGTKVRSKSGHDKDQVVTSSIFWWHDAECWCFADREGYARQCRLFGPIPPEASVTLRVTGDPATVAFVKDMSKLRGLRVEVVE